MKRIIAMALVPVVLIVTACASRSGATSAPESTEVDETTATNSGPDFTRGSLWDAAAAVVVNPSVNPTSVQELAQLSDLVVHGSVTAARPGAETGSYPVVVLDVSDQAGQKTTMEMAVAGRFDSAEALRDKIPTEAALGFLHEPIVGRGNYFCTHAEFCALVERDGRVLSATSPTTDLSSIFSDVSEKTSLLDLSRAVEGAT